MMMMMVSRDTSGSGFLRTPRGGCAADGRTSSSGEQWGNLFSPSSAASSCGPRRTAPARTEPAAPERDHRCLLRPQRGGLAAGSPAGGGEEPWRAAAPRCSGEFLCVNYAQMEKTEKWLIVLVFNGLLKIINRSLFVYLFSCQILEFLKVEGWS